jgi:hypothetical protein
VTPEVGVAATTEVDVAATPGVAVVTFSSCNYFIF